MLAEDRRKKIMELLNKSGSVQVSELTEILNVSLETIRRDLENLENRDLLKKVHGGAILENFNKLESFNVRSKEFSKEKYEIASTALKYIKENASIALDASTTNLEISKKLKLNFKNLTIVTNSLLIALELADVENFNIFLTGGKLISSQYSFVGALSLQNLDNFFVDTSFISTSGISLESGVTEYNLFDVEIQKKMIEISKKSIILADHSKFDKTALIKVTELNKINTIITDSQIDENTLNKYLNNDLNVIYK